MTYLSTLSEPLKDKYFTEYVLNKNNKKYFTNLFNEIREDVAKNFNKNITSDTTINSSSLKLSFVLKINEKLGIDNSMTSTSISRETLSTIDNYLVQNLDSIQTVFSFDKTHITIHN